MASNANPWATFSSLIRECSLLILRVNCTPSGNRLLSRRCSSRILPIYRNFCNVFLFWMCNKSNRFRRFTVVDKKTISFIRKRYMNNQMCFFRQIANHLGYNFKICRGNMYFSVDYKLLSQMEWIDDFRCKPRKGHSVFASLMDFHCDWKLWVVVLWWNFLLVQYESFWKVLKR